MHVVILHSDEACGVINLKKIHKYIYTIFTQPKLRNSERNAKTVSFLEKI